MVQARNEAGRNTSTGNVKSMRSQTRLSAVLPAGDVRKTFHEQIEEVSHQAAVVAANLERLTLFRPPATLLAVENGLDFYAEMRRFEISLIVSALKHTRGSQTEAARLLKMKLTTLSSKIKTYEIAWRKCVNRS
jgi:DNA-binding NtrC family response regulator